MLSRVTGYLNATGIVPRAVVSYFYGRGYQKTRYFSTESGSDSESEGDVSKIITSHWGDYYIPRNTSYTRILLERFSTNPQRIAMINGINGEEYSYSRVIDHVVRLADSMTKRGVGKGSVVTILAPNSVEIPLFMMATCLTGAVLNPINSALISDEVHTLMKLIKPEFLVTSSELLNNLSDTNVDPQKIFTVDNVEGHASFKELLSEGQLIVPKPEISCHDPALIPHSSGTTGLPKGVVLSHQNLNAQIMALGNPQCSPMRKDGRTILVFPMAHIGGINILLNNLYALSTTILFPTFDFQQFLQAIETYKVTVVTVPPTVNVRLYNDPLVDNYDLSSVQRMVSGAAPIKASIQQGVLHRLNVHIFQQAYGMTETTGVSHVDDIKDPAIGSAGKVLPNMKVKIIDPVTLEDLEPTSVGEVCMKGPLVMSGYLNDPDATYRTMLDAQWIKTGDIGYHDENDHLYIIDRNKDMIKYKGLQVSPAELEAVLLSHPDVTDAAVIGIPDDTAGEVPKAFVVLAPGMDNAEHLLQKFVAERVSKHKQIRGGVLFVNEIPKLSSGKILKRVLRGEILT